MGWRTVLDRITSLGGQSLCCGAGAVDTVGTTGLVELQPNAVNSVPREAKLEIDVRDIDGQRRDVVVAEVAP